MLSLPVVLSTPFLLAVPAHAQQSSVSSRENAMPVHALELEQAGRLREAAIAYRAALREGALVPSVLGLERVYSMMGASDSLLPLLDTLLAQRPRDAVLRTVQLRTLTSLRRDDEAMRAFEQWVRVAPRNVQPFREFARLLLDENRIATADTVLQRAQRVFGSPRDFALEIAQLRASLGLWAQSADAWREAIRREAYLDQAAIFSLYPAPAAARDSIRVRFLAPPVESGARGILAGLELRWRSPSAGWAALRDLPPNDSSVDAWLRFADQAEDNQSWLVARDALAAAVAVRPTDSLALRGAADAMNGGDAAGALTLLGHASSSVSRTVAAAALRVRALAALGRAQEADDIVRGLAASSDSGALASLRREVAWGWIRAGDLAHARDALRAAGGDDDRATGWIALYEGDLAAARRTLKRAAETSGDLVLALAFLSRTRADSGVSAGQAFLALTRGDTTQAAARFVTAAEEREMADAAPLLLATAARLYAARADTAHARALWQTLVTSHADAPEAAEAELEWARALRQAGDARGAVEHLEHLILTWPESALVPQARRELDLARGAVPPAR